MIKSMRLIRAGHVKRMGRGEMHTRFLVGTPEGKRSLGRPRHRWGDIRMDLREIGWGGMDWIRLIQDRDQCRAVVNTVMNRRVL
jgi:hypothetical protein